MPLPPGRLYDAGGYRLHAWQAGFAHAGSAPPVVLHSGLLSPALAWLKVLPLIGEFAPVVAIDRPGYGWSDPAPEAILRTGRQVVAETRALLGAAGLQPPYILVGHSIGAIFCLTHAYEHADEVAGLVLVDPSHPRQMQVRGLPSTRVYRWNVGFVGALVGSRWGKGMGGLVAQQMLGAVRATLTPAEWEMALACFKQPAFYDSALAEVAVLDATLAAADRPPGSLGAIPLTILEAGDWFSSRSLGMRAAVRALRQEMLTLSSRAAHRIVPNTNHVTLPLLAPESVADAVREIAAAPSA